MGYSEINAVLVGAIVLKCVCICVCVCLCVCPLSVLRVKSCLWHFCVVNKNKMYLLVCLCFCSCILHRVYLNILNIYYIMYETCLLVCVSSRQETWPGLFHYSSITLCGDRLPPLHYWLIIHHTHTHTYTHPHCHSAGVPSLSPWPTSAADGLWFHNSMLSFQTTSIH